MDSENEGIGTAVKSIIRAGKDATQLQDPKPFTGHGYNKLLIPKRTGEHQQEYTLMDLPVAPKAKLRPPMLAVHTLSGVVRYLEANKDGLELTTLAIHVVNERQVRVLGPVDGAEAAGEIPERTVYVQATFNELTPGGDPPFKFGTFTDPESFNIALQALFEDAEDRAAVLAVAGNLRSSRAENYDDSGTAQKVQVEHGVDLGRGTVIPNPVKLRPWRTFRDVTQPSSKYVFRARGGSDQKPPELALFEADGGAWKLAAIENIRAFFTDKFAGVAVIA